MESILITGGAGYIGSHVALAAERAGYMPLLLDWKAYTRPWACSDYLTFNYDINNTLEWDWIIRKYSVKKVIHLASFIEVGESVQKPFEYYQNNVIASINCLRACINHGVKYIAFASSAAVYGNVVTGLTLTPNLCPAPVSPYGTTKLIMEKFLSDVCSTSLAQCVSLRLFNVAGASKERNIGELHHPETHLIPRVLKNTLDGVAEFNIYGNDYPTPDGTCIRDYVHVEDVATAFLNAISYLETGGRGCILNVGSGVGTSINEIIEAVESETSCKIDKKYSPRRPGDPSSLIANIDDTKIILNWLPGESNIKTIVSDAYRWHKHASDNKLT